MSATCRVCAGPLTAVSDDPDLSHPSCAPADPSAYEAATSGPRAYGHGTPLAWWFTCGCGTRVEAGVQVEMRDTVDGRRWVCPDCSARTSPQSAHTVSAPVPAIPAPRAASDAAGPPYGPVPAPRTTTDTDAPRRAVA